MKKRLTILVLCLIMALSVFAVFTACDDPDEKDCCPPDPDPGPVTFSVEWDSSEHLTVTSNAATNRATAVQPDNVVYIQINGTIDFDWSISAAHLLTHINDGFIINVYNNDTRIHRIYEAGNPNRNTETQNTFSLNVTANSNLYFSLETVTTTLLTPLAGYQMMNDLREDDTNFVILDVRQLNEFLEQRIQGAIMIPYQLTLTLAQSEIGNPNRVVGQLPVQFNVLGARNTVIFVYCRAGRRSAIVSAILAGHGFSNVYDIGGTIYDVTHNANNPNVDNQTQGDGWVGAGLPTVSGCSTNPEDCTARQEGFPCISPVYWGAVCQCPPRQTTCPVCDNEILDGFYCECPGRMIRFNFSSDFLGAGNWGGLVIRGLYDMEGNRIELAAINGGRIDGGNLIGHIEITQNTTLRLKIDTLQSIYAVDSWIDGGAPFALNNGDGYQYIEIYINLFIIGNQGPIDINIHLEYNCPT